jgi:hypothetical protein
MPVKKKTNYVSYQVERLKVYIESINQYLDDNPIDQMTDRIERFEGLRGMPMIRVIAKKEDQIKCFMDRLKELPKLLSDYNDLLKSLDGKEADVVLRGEVDKPGFMTDAEVIKEDEEEKMPEMRKFLPSNEEMAPTDFDDDEYWNDEEF